MEMEMKDELQAQMERLAGVAQTLEQLVLRWMARPRWGALWRRWELRAEREAELLERLAEAERTIAELRASVPAAVTHQSQRRTLPVGLLAKQERAGARTGQCGAGCGAGEPEPGAADRGEVAAAARWAGVAERNARRVTNGGAADRLRALSILQSAIFREDEHEREVYGFLRGGGLHWDLARSKFRCTRRRFWTWCAGAACLGSASSRCRRPGIRRASLKRRRFPAPACERGFVDPRNIVAPVVSPTRVERSVPLKALVAQINYNLFDIELGKQQSQFAYLQAKDLTDTVEGVLRTHDVALWNGTDTSLSTPTTAQYFGAAGQIAAGGNTTTIRHEREHCGWSEVDHCADGVEHVVWRCGRRRSMRIRCCWT